MLYYDECDREMAAAAGRALLPVCGGCGQEAVAVAPAGWDPTVLVGDCCAVYTDHRCPDCGSDDLAFREYDYGRDSETGYHDAGVRAICRQCGCNCDERDTEVRIGPRVEPRPVEVAALVPEYREEVA